MLTPQYPERVRPQEAEHNRSIPQQQLDALLRIEEQLVKMNASLSGWRPPMPWAPNAEEKAEENTTPKGRKSGVTRL